MAFLGETDGGRIGNSDREVGHRRQVCLHRTFGVRLRLTSACGLPVMTRIGNLDYADESSCTSACGLPVRVRVSGVFGTAAAAAPSRAGSRPPPAAPPPAAPSPPACPTLAPPPSHRGHRRRLRRREPPPPPAPPPAWTVPAALHRQPRSRAAPRRYAVAPTVPARWADEPADSERGGEGGPGARSRASP